MMRWEHEVTHTANALMAVLARGTTGADLDVALTARAAVLDHVATVLGDLVPHTRPDEPWVHWDFLPLRAIESDPIASLGHVLRGRARPHLTRSPSELLDPAAPRDATTAAWIEVGRRAVLADQAWSSAPVYRLEPEAAWDALAEAASLAQAVAVLDIDLATSAPERADARAVLNSTAGLRAAASEVLILAGTSADGRPGPAAVPGPERPLALSPAEAISGRSPRRSGLVHETGRLQALLDQAEELTPNHIRASVQVARNLCLLSAASATSATGTDLRTELGEMARALHAGTQHDGEVAVSSIPVRALELQIRELHVATRRGLAGTPLRPDDANRLARRLPDLVDVIADKTRDQIDQSRWGVPDRSAASTFRYAVASRVHPEHIPALLTAIEQAAVSAEILRSRVAPSPVAVATNTALAAAVRSLRGIVHDRGVTRTRAAHPAHPITHRLGPAPDREVRAAGPETSNG